MSIASPYTHARPTRQLLEFYRKKITQYEHEDEKFADVIVEFKDTLLEQSQLDQETKARDSEVAELQRALSDMQVCLFKEREQVIKLHQDNDKFKARDFDNKKTVQQLLALRGGAQDGEVSYFFKEPPEQIMVTNNTQLRRSQDGSRVASLTEHQTSLSEAQKMQAELRELQATDCISLQLQVEALKSQIEDQSRWAREQVQALNEDKVIKEEEDETRASRDLAKIKVFAERLHKTQDLLYNNTQTVLKMRDDSQGCEQKWIEERKQLLLDVDKVQGRLNREWNDNLQASTAPHKPDQSFNQSNSSRVFPPDELLAIKQNKKKLKEELGNSERMCEMYREQLISLEDEIASYRDKEVYATDIFKDKSEKVQKRYEIMKERYHDLEKRRNLEVEGFKNDIKSLRKQLKDMEKQIYKATLKTPTSHTASHLKSTELDMNIFHNVKKTNQKSLMVGGKLRNLKDQVYQLQTDLNHL